MYSVLVFSIIIASVLLMGLLVVLSRYLGLYLQCHVANAHVTWLELIGMRLRKVDLRSVLISHIRLRKAGVDIPLSWLETHDLAGGSPANVAAALITTRRAGKVMHWEEAAAIDLGPDDLLTFVHELCPEKHRPSTRPDN